MRFDAPMTGAIALAFLLAAAVVSDWRARRIPNLLVVTIAVLGIARAGLLSGAHGAGVAVGGVALGLALWLPFYAMGKMAAGDVKLFAAAGAWLTPWQVVDAALLTAFVGGVLSVCWLIGELGVRQGLLRVLLTISHRGALLQSYRDVERRRWLPYGISMSIGVVLALLGTSIVKA